MSIERLDSSSQPASSKPLPLAKVSVPIAQSTVLSKRPWTSKSMPLVTAASLLLHAVVLGGLAMVVLKNPQLMEEIFTTVTDTEEVAEPIVEQSMLQPETVETSTETVASQETTSNLQFETKGAIDLNISDGIPQIEASASNLPGLADIKMGSETSGRMSAVNRKTMIQKFGGNSASEASVASGMKWLTNHQMADGSWSFEHSKHPDCKGQCSQDGTFTACPTGATGLALLAFLGGGHTHQKGDYQKPVKRAIDFLLKSAVSTPAGLDLRGKVTANEGMYVQGLCTIALCECSAMTKDTRVRKAAEGAIDFIVKAQNSKDGGWRYNPGDPGDTSVVGWQVMALKSGYNAKLKFPPQAFKGAEVFLKLAQAEGGSQYRYDPQQKDPPSPSMTAVGLLCRMYLGWDQKNKKLAEGVEYLDKIRPQPNNMYFNYYATQVMHHWGGEEWTRWNEVMREQLVRTQHSLKDGHLAGSWDVADPHGGAGGRLYMTCLSVMTLEVYYRHLPMYSREHIKVEF
jgi:hypothetical protein